MKPVELNNLKKGDYIIEYKADLSKILRIKRVLVNNRYGIIFEILACVKRTRSLNPNSFDTISYI